MKCSIKNCDRDLFAKGMCESHYRRKLRNPTATTAQLNAPVRESRGTLSDVSTRVSAEVHAALETLGGVYAGAATVLEAWAAGKPLPKRPRIARKAA